jgi:glycosyltransferase involved in cell wall biosynthesis
MSGVPILSQLLAQYFESKDISAGLWSIASPKSMSNKLIGYGNFQTMVSTFVRLPQTMFLNTTCVEATFIDDCLELLARKQIRKLILYSHEDLVVLPKKTIQLLDIADDSACFVYAGSAKTARTLQKHFKRKVILSAPYQIAQSPRIKRIRQLGETPDFFSLNIVLVGSTADNRKGHVRVARAIRWARRLQSLNAFLRIPGLRREINLTVVGAHIFPDVDLISSKVIELLNRHVTILPVIELQAYLEMLEGQNAVICLSQYETLPLYVSEAMARGCLVLRNNCGGMEEQLVENKNGIRLANSAIRNGFRIFLLSRENEYELKKRSRASISRFDEIHSKDWDLNFTTFM